MKISEKPAVDLNEVIDALDLNFDSVRYFVNTITGQVICLTEGEDFSDIEEEVEDDFIPDHYIPLPDNWELDKYEIMEDFCCSLEEGEIQENLLRAIRGRGAFGRFKTAIHCYGNQEDWYQFLHNSLKEIAIEFCKAHKLPYKYVPRKSE